MDIKDLWVKAQDDTVNVPYDELFAERFAKLIIEQCISITVDVETKYNTYRRSTDDFSEKNRLAEGENSAELIRKLIRKLIK
jgi:hypothetical protein